jgi:hypothetical protein
MNTPAQPGNADLRRQLNDMIRGYWTTQALFVASELDIPAHLSDRPRTPTELADRTGARADAIYRILRALASVGVFVEDEDGRFGLTPLAEVLGSAGGRGYARLHGQELYRAWSHILDTARGGLPAFIQEHGAPLFEYLKKNPERGQVFDEAMTGHHGDETDPMLDAYDFSPFREVVDVGGGNGSLLMGTLGRHPHLRGTLFDLPAVIDRARADIRTAGMEDKIRLVGGSFLEPGSIPSGADAYVLRHVVHDWDDDHTVTILKHTREAADPSASILVVEMVIPPGNAPYFGKWLDLMMMCYGGKERTEREYGDLFERAGLRLTRAVDAGAGISVVEGVNARP